MTFLCSEFKQADQRRRPHDLAEAHRRLIEETVAAVFAVPVGKIRAPSRGSASVAFARQVAMYLAHIVLGHSYTAIGHSFGRDRTTVAHACALVEDVRDNPPADCLLSALECVLEPLARQARA
jgi:chromosomal replication initiation ATPase DnaA